MSRSQSGFGNLHIPSPPKVVYEVRVCRTPTTLQTALVYNIRGDAVRSSVSLASTGHMCNTCSSRDITQVTQWPWVNLLLCCDAAVGSAGS